MQKLLEAIVAPQLAHFTFWGYGNCDPQTKVFDGLEHKLIDIQHLILRDLRTSRVS